MYHYSPVKKFLSEQFFVGSAEPGLHFLVEVSVPQCSEAVFQYWEPSVSVTADPGGSQSVVRFLEI